MVALVLSFVQDEVFTFTPEGEDEEIHIYSGRLRRWLLEKAMDKVIDMTFPVQPLDEIVRQHGLEAPRMASMTEEEALEPVIIGLWPSGHHVLIDGGHRRWFWAKRGRHVIRGWAVPEEVWRLFQMHPGDALVAVHHRDGSTLPQRKDRG